MTNDLSSLRLKILRFISAEQTKEHANPRHVGVWPSAIHFLRVIPETNIFTALTIVNMLEELGEDVRGEAGPAVSLFTSQLQMYFDDARRTSEPAGTVAFWPLWETPEGRAYRAPTPALDYINVPNDLDDSSQAAVWLMRRSELREPFVHDFVHAAGRYRDVNRLRQSPGEQRWKRLNSGAFLTWTEEEGEGTRRLLNDVDCVVNLNVLAALERYCSLGASLPTETELSYQSAKSLVIDVAEHDKIGNCCEYYVRGSQVLMGFARVYLAGGETWMTDLAPKLGAIVAREAFKALAGKTVVATELAELIIALKTFHPTPRPPHITELADRLTRGIVSGLRIEDQFARVAKAEAIYRATFGSPYLWVCPAANAATVLYALAMR